MRVSGLTTMSASLQSNSLLKVAIVNRVALSVQARCLLALDEERELFPEEEILGGEGTPGKEVTTKSDGIEHDM
jgi:hypothetical protein